MARRFRKGRSKGSGRSLAGSEKQKLKKRIEELRPTGDQEDWPDDLGLEDQLAVRRAAPRKMAEPPPGNRKEAKSPAPHKQRPNEEDEASLEADVVSLASGLCWVRSDSGTELECVLPSKLASEQQSSLAVGDRVRISADESRAHRVLEVLPRRTVLSRPDPHNPRRERVIATNVDVVVHVASVKTPPLRTALIDRYLIAIERSGAEALICVNKFDLLDTEEERQRIRQELAPYAQLGLRILYCSAHRGDGMEELRQLLVGRTAVVVGHSGVGKSSLLNRLAPELEQHTAEVSSTHGTGRHTTTRSSLHLLGDGIRLIDTPGIRELGLWRLSSAELATYFPDLEEKAAGCRFSNCSHTHEPECAVRAADQEGELNPGRYATYLRIRDSLG